MNETDKSWLECPNCEKVFLKTHLDRECCSPVCARLWWNKKRRKSTREEKISALMEAIEADIKRILKP